MFDILSGKVEFYPGWKVQDESSFKAPSLKKPTSRLAPSSAQELMDEMHLGSELQQDLHDMMKLIRTNDNLQEEA